ncbi:intermembrane transport protein PqiB [Phaeovulum sp.]|uniref:PqiB family protein n=1 Tax=Phaeovulum sp. TaxID=2934796 RepID=UPI0039E6D502
MSQDPTPAALIKTQAPSPIWTRLSVIWLVPLLALAITLGVAWKSYSERGILIEIDFADATGIRPGESVLKFREVEVGRVETVGFTSDLKSVRIGVRVQKDVAPFIDSDAKFWLVRPEVSAQGISRLDTVLSGTFIEGYWDAEPSTPQTRFTGQDRAPLAPDPTSGTWVTLHADDAGGLAEGAPVIFRGLTVGRLQNLRLSETDEGVTVDAFIKAPHDKRLSSRTRFWDTSGFSLSLGAGGVKLDVRSLASLVQGGIEFATFSSGGQPIMQGDSFRLYSGETEAQSSIFDGSSDTAVRFTILFDEAVRGIERGTKVLFRGVEAGEVKDLSVKVSQDSFGDRIVRQQIVIAINPERLGMTPDADPDIVAGFLEGEVERGLRARLAGTGLLGTTLVVELTDIPDMAPGKMDMAGDPFPILPVAPAAANDLAASAEGVLSRVSALPIEELFAATIRMMDSISVVAESDDTRAVPGELSILLEELGNLTKALNDQGAADKTIAALDQVMSAAEQLYASVEGLPETLVELQKLAANAALIPLEDIGNQVDGILSDLRTMLGSDDAEKLPRALSDTLTEAAGLLAELRAGGAADNLNAALGSAQTAADALAGASADLPALTERLEGLIARADGLIASYGDRSPFNAEMLNTMRELRRATAAFGALARTIERNPRAFILGR